MACYFIWSIQTSIIVNDGQHDWAIYKARKICEIASTKPSNIFTESSSDLYKQTLARLSYACAREPLSIEAYHLTAPIAVIVRSLGTAVTISDAICFTWILHCPFCIYHIHCHYAPLPLIATAVADIFFSALSCPICLTLAVAAIIICYYYWSSLSF